MNMPYSIIICKHWESVEERGFSDVVLIHDIKLNEEHTKNIAFVTATYVLGQPKKTYIEFLAPVRFWLLGV